MSVFSIFGEWIADRQRRQYAQTAMNAYCRRMEAQQDAEAALSVEFRRILEQGRKAILFECKDYADGWITFKNEREARAYQDDTGCLMRIYYKAK